MDGAAREEHRLGRAGARAGLGATEGKGSDKGEAGEARQDIKQAHGGAASKPYDWSSARQRKRAGDLDAGLILPIDPTQVAAEHNALDPQLLEARLHVDLLQALGRPDEAVLQNVQQKQDLFRACKRDVQTRAVNKKPNRGA